MAPTCLYDTPESFARMMMNKVEESTPFRVRREGEDPLLFLVAVDPEDEKNVLRVSLHTTYQSYRNTGDLNTAVDFLNGTIRVLADASQPAKLIRIRPDRIYPALRDKQYVEEAAQDTELLTDEFVPGLNIVYLETSEAYCKLINKAMLEQSGRFTPEEIRRLAYRNLRRNGWVPPNLTLPVPTCKSCEVEVYLHDKVPGPMDCQFFDPELAAGHMAESCLLAFPNRKVTLVLRSVERMESESDVRRLVKKSRFRSLVERSCRVMPHPVTNQIYWYRKGLVVRV